MPFPSLPSTPRSRQISPLAEASNRVAAHPQFPRLCRAFAKPDSRLRPGMNGGMDIIINRIPNAISIPAKALFTRDGKPIVYLAE